MYNCTNVLLLCTVLSVFINNVNLLNLIIYLVCNVMYTYLYALVNTVLRMYIILFIQ